MLFSASTSLSREAYLHLTMASMMSMADQYEALSKLLQPTDTTVSDPLVQWWLALALTDPTLTCSMVH